jgi:hypothetical protein
MNCIKNLDQLLKYLEWYRASISYFDRVKNVQIDLDEPSSIDQMKSFILSFIMPFLYIVLMFVSLVGNLMIIMVILYSKSMKKSTSMFMFNLAICDLAILFSCIWVQIPLNLNEYWVLGQAFCKINSYMQMVSIVSSVLTLSMIACDRFIGIMYPFTSRLIGKNTVFSLRLNL